MSKSFNTAIIFFISLLFFVSFCTVAENKNEPKQNRPLQGKNIAFLLTEGFHDGETMFPMGFLYNKGAEITVIGVEPGEYQAYNSEVTALVTFSVSEVSPGDFDALVIPGGLSPSNLREHEEVNAFVRSFFELNKPTAAICHGPQVLASAGVLTGRTLTGVRGIQEELENAGAIFEDAEVMVDGQLITSRTPPDLPAFSRQILHSLLQK